MRQAATGSNTTFCRQHGAKHRWQILLDQQHLRHTSYNSRAKAHREVGGVGEQDGPAAVDPLVPAEGMSPCVVCAEKSGTTLPRRSTCECVAAGYEHSQCRYGLEHKHRTALTCPQACDANVSGGVIMRRITSIRHEQAFARCREHRSSCRWVARNGAPHRWRTLGVELAVGCDRQRTTVRERVRISNVGNFLLQVEH